jgi:hypothetical protein
MSEIEPIFRAFVESYRRDPSTDPRGYLAQVDAVDREELRVRIEAFLERAPLERWNPNAYPGSIAERAIAAASPEMESPAVEVAQGWPQLLPALRNRARLRRATVVERLAAALDFADDEERVAAYYHRMERGQLPPSGVSTKVLEALGSILGATAASLRESGQAGEFADASGGEVFARLGAPDAAASRQAEGAEVRSASDLAREPDELDLLFIGGD